MIVPTTIYCSTENLQIRSVNNDVDPVELYQNIRHEDLEECFAISDDVYSMITASISASEYSWSALYKGELVAIFGLALYPKNPLMGAPWMVCTDAITKCPIEVLRESRVYLSFMLERYTGLMNFVLDTNESAIRYLKYLGFEVGFPQQYGPKNSMFRVFMMAKGELKLRDSKGCVVYR